MFRVNQSWRSVAAILGMTTVLGLGGVGCGGTAGEEEVFEDPNPTVDGNLEDAEVDEPPEIGKADAVLGTRALPKSGDTSSTQVWAVTRNWSDKVNKDFPPYFKVSDNLTWNQAYRRFNEKLEAISTAAGGQKTFKIVNPQGKSMPSPVLECSEQAMFLRIAFASWFNLPFFLEAIDGSRTRMFAGHMGFRTMTGKYKTFPDFKSLYKDYTATATAANWPHDAKLRTKKVGYDDDQSGPTGVAGSGIGVYADELFANKRVGYFLALVIDWFGSVNLADSANTFNLKPEGIAPGDIQLERWQRQGIGHTLTVHTVEKLPNGKLSVALTSGSMPRRQAILESPVTSRRYFLLEYTGGEGNSDDGTPYAKLGGGLHRWRVAVTFQGTSWVNMVPGDSSAMWINSTNTAAIAARPKQFETLLDVPDPAARRTELIRALAETRANQMAHPASCSTREKREGLLNDLAELEEEENGWSRDETERQYRSFHDYVFPQLKYEKSKTCCWNSTTAAMGDIVMAYNNAQQNATQQCRLPTPFMNQNGYAVFKNFAVSQGKGAQWPDWREDEPCPQRTVASDTIDTNVEAAEFCDIRDDLKD